MTARDGKLLPPCPCTAPGDEPEHDIELYETNRAEKVYQCMLCGFEVRYPREFGPEDVA